MKAFKDFRLHLKNTGWQGIFATISIWCVWFTGKWFLKLYTSDSLATQIITVYIPVGITFFGVLSDLDGRGNALRAFWKGWRELSIRTHLLIIVGSISMIYIYKLIAVYFRKGYFEQPDIKDLRLIAYGKN